MKIVLPLRQHVGGPCKPIVQMGSEVKKGQLIAVPEGLGANIHSSVYGKVALVDENSITIEAHEEQPDEFVKLSDSDDYIELIKEAGIVGAGGAGFPAHIKFSADLSSGGMVIANAAECEPILNHNTLLMEENPEIVVKGLMYAMEITKASEGIIAIKKIHMKAAMAMAKACKDIKNINVKFLPNMYPAGDERVIVREMTGVELKPGQLPLEANAVVANVETLKNISRAIDDRRPVITKDITVGGRVESAKTGEVFLDVPMGAPISQYIEKCGGFVKPYGEIVLGGPFTGKKGSEDSPVTKTLGGILVAMPFPSHVKKVGIIACECGAQEERLREIAESMGAVVVAEKKCKRMTDDGRGRYRCDLPGTCPGQAETVLYLKKHGAETVITGTCED
ncbi:proline reductase-associated electron transfer protein PrdC [Peptoclostridium litorale DSM 5388]|uniref:Electron transfer protein PrdC n=2 Tax=Peptoclostridium litorale TaxID=1557 RepID=A0A069RM57_PEPLI|nr:electron transfer protein PrdC [Peptoclostridium litorale DSM 5388]KDR95287.1 electron transfer protein PrdC [Peptoclostridium litorale DSM 5388]SIN87311.1 proline reductase-associated electron transfer protein PrdC [Peptoclostridium litorale DSM 5388]